MSSTDFAAWYAAAVATVVFVWDIVKWSQTGPRLRVITACNVYYTDGRVISRQKVAGGGESAELADYCHIEVLNVGAQPTTLIDIQISHTPRGDGEQISATASAFTRHAGSNPLPALIAPGEMWSARIEMSHLDSVAQHGSLPIVRIRASHRTKAIETAIDYERRISE